MEIGNLLPRYSVKVLFGIPPTGLGGFSTRETLKKQKNKTGERIGVFFFCYPGLPPLRFDETDKLKVQRCLTTRMKRSKQHLQARAHRHSRVLVLRQLKCWCTFSRASQGRGIRLAQRIRSSKDAIGGGTSGKSRACTKTRSMIRRALQGCVRPELGTRHPGARARFRLAVADDAVKVERVEEPTSRCRGSFRSGPGRLSFCG